MCVNSVHVVLFGRYNPRYGMITENSHSMSVLPSFLRAPLPALLILSMVAGVLSPLCAQDDPFDAEPDYALERNTCPTSCSVPNSFELIPAATILQLIAVDHKIQELLVHDMYHVTYPLFTRALTTYPTLSPLLQDRPLHCWDITTKPFFIFTPRRRFTSKSSKICSYLTSLTRDNFLQALDDIFTTLDIPSLLPLFGAITIEQRQLGFLFYLQAQRDRWFWSVALPVYYLEDNYHLSPEDMAALENSPVFSSAGAISIPLPSLDPRTFLNDHCVSDKVGIGDLRGEVWYRAAQHECGFADVGIQMTLPTAIAMTTGITGAMPGTFCLTRPTPYVDLQTIVSLFVAQQATGDRNAATDLANYTLCLGVEALDRLGAIILDTPLGEQHATIGAVLTGKGQLHHTTGLQLSGEFTYYIPARETRCFKTIIDPTALVNRNYGTENPAQAQADLNMLSQRVTDILFPVVTDIRVHPGFMCNITAACLFEQPSYQATFGFNIWGRTREQLGSLLLRYPVSDPLADRFSPPRYIPLNNLNLTQGTRHGAYSGKLFGAITSIIHSPSGYDTRVGLRGDATIFTSNIGYDVTIGADFIIDF